MQNLLDMTSGIAWMELGVLGTPSSSLTEMARSPDWVQYILDRPMQSGPGEACEKTGWLVDAWVLMSNHYHLVRAKGVSQQTNPD